MFVGSCSILFICFILVISIVSFCAISVLLYFWNYDVLDYSACYLGIRLPMFVQHFTIPGSNSSFNVSSIEEVVCWEMLQKKRQKLHQLTTKNNDRRSPHGGYLIFSTVVNYLRRGILTLCKGRTLWYVTSCALHWCTLLKRYFVLQF